MIGWLGYGGNSRAGAGSAERRKISSWEQGMRIERIVVSAAAAWMMCAAPVVAATVEDFRNEKVVVTEVKLAPGEDEAINGLHPSVVVYLAGYEAQIKFGDGEVKRESIVRGETLREPAEAGVLTNTGREALHLVRVEFLTAGSGEIWGRTGLSPGNQMIFEDEESRTYNIRLEAHGREPEHSHHARVAVCLSGAQIEHTLPDGSVHAANLKTDEVTWRPAETHKGQSLSDTNLWVVAIEPK
jgi:hypothetical protein